MDTYLKGNQAYWEKGYNAPNVDHQVFRFFGRILKPQFNLPQNNETLLDFGCGQGAAVNYFSANGFDAYGVDISNYDVGVARNRYPHINGKFQVCAPKPSDNLGYGPFGIKYRVITAIQSLYYFSKDDFQTLMKKLYDQMESGGVLFATMMGEQCKEFYDNSKPTEDEWLRRVDFENSRISVSGYHMFFIKDEDDLRDKFSMFEPVHIGYYATQLRSDEGNGFHYTFCGVKK